MELRRFVLVLGFGLAVSVIDYFILDVVLAPLFSLLFLFFVSMRWKPLACAYAGVVLLCVVVCAFWGMEIQRIAVRSSTFGVGIVLAVSASRMRLQAEKKTKMASDIFDLCPLPMIVSDFTGAIRNVNKTLAKMLPKDSCSIIGQTFSDVFLVQYPPGVAMETYCENFIDEKYKDIDLQIISGRRFSGSCYFVGEGRNREMLIVVGDAAEN